MEDRVEWKAEVTFSGTTEEFTRFAESINQFNINVYIPGWPHPWPGLMPFPGDIFFRNKLVKAFADKMPRIRGTIVDDIAGGIRTPHLHLGEDIVLVDRVKFQSLLEEIVVERGMLGDDPIPTGQR